MSTDVHPLFEPKKMVFRRLGSSGLRVPVFSLGGGLTLGGTVKGDHVNKIIRVAWENGINMFDTAEAYAKGNSEVEMGRVIKELNLRRTDLVISTKLFWGLRAGPNDGGLSRKHIIEGTKESLQRLQLDYVDIIFAHRPDPTVQAFYWGTSEWPAHQIEEAHHVATKFGLIAPVAEQCMHHMLARERVESEYGPLYNKYQLGTAAFSALAAGLLTGKYNDGIPENTRFKNHPDFYGEAAAKLSTEAGAKDIAKIKLLTELAEKELNCSVAALALAWTAKAESTSTVILGATNLEQLLENLKALDVIHKLTPAVLEKVEIILDNKPKPQRTYRNSTLDQFGRR